MNELVPLNGAIAQAMNPASIMPVMSIDDILHRKAELNRYREQAMTPGVDYGVVPGTGGKPTLLKPGAEKLCTLFGLSVTFDIIERTEDWSGKNHNNEPFFYYLYRCRLSRGAQVVAESDGSCNSWEKKYRWRNAGALCPECGKAAIMRSKYPPRHDPDAIPGWYCNPKNEGCGTNFGFNAIENATSGKVPNPDIADQVNTLQKMAMKRALVGTTLIAVNASEYFTQDVEDMPEFGGSAATVESEATQQPERQQRPQARQSPARRSAPVETVISKGQIDTILGYGRAYFGDDNETGLSDYLDGEYGKSLEQLTCQQAEAVKRMFDEELKKRDGAEPGQVEYTGPIQTRTIIKLRECVAAYCDVTASDLLSIEKEIHDNCGKVISEMDEQTAQDLISEYSARVLRPVAMMDGATA